jgi:hemerythrin-like domain-containing protein
MNKSIETMMSEHRLIEQVLGALDTLVSDLQAGKLIARYDVGRFASFFRDFADKLHHGKEEDRLFQQMNQCGFPREYGPVAVMLSEHDAGRAHVRALAEIGAGTGPLGEAERDAIIEHGRAYVPLLLAHIQKEDNVLYPMAQQAISPAVFAKLDAECEAFERSLAQSTNIEALKTLATELIQTFPPDAGRLAAAQLCMGCAGHH